MTSPSISTVRWVIGHCCWLADPQPWTWNKLSLTISQHIDICWLEAPGIYGCSLTERRVRLRNRQRVTEVNRDRIALRMEHTCNQSCRQNVSQSSDSPPVKVSSPTKNRGHKRRKQEGEGEPPCEARLIVRSLQAAQLTHKIQCTVEQIERRKATVFEIPAPDHPLPPAGASIRMSDWARRALHNYASCFGVTKSRLQTCSSKQNPDC